MLTLQKLEYIADVCSRIRQIKTELQSVYYAYTSPRFDGVKYTNQPADPTAKAFYQAERLHNEMDRLLAIRMDFEDELEQITDHEICAIIRWHYILGKSWKVTSVRVYGTQSYFLARDRLRWFIAPHHEPEKST